MMSELSSHLQFLHRYIYLEALTIFLQEKIFFLLMLAFSWENCHARCNVNNGNKPRNIYHCENKGQQAGGNQLLPSTFPRINKKNSEEDTNTRY